MEKQNELVTILQQIAATLPLGIMLESLISRFLYHKEFERARLIVKLASTDAPPDLVLAWGKAINDAEKAGGLGPKMELLK